MNEIVLELAALPLSLFCLIYSLAARRELYFPLPKGALERLKSKRCVFLIMLGAIVAAVIASLVEALAFSLDAQAGVLVALHTASLCFRCLLFPFLALYILSLCGPIKDQRVWFFGLFFVPLLVAEALILTNPLTQLCFTYDASLAWQPGLGLWIVDGICVIYALVGLLCLARFGGTLPKIDRIASVILICIVIVGLAVQAFWAIPTELFFESVVVFGFMALLEQEDDLLESGMSNRSRNSLVAAVGITFIIAVFLNVVLITNLTSAQSDRIGNTELNVIRGDLEDTLSQAKTDVLRVGLGAEQLLDEHASLEQIGRYFEDQRDTFRSNESFMNVYIAGPDWHFVPDFEAPENFHASERVWYLGAKENPDEVFITEPYLDVNTGDMCFTVSTLLSDGETVVAMDYNFSEVQDTIERMTGGGDQEAMIVTSDGQVVGYTDMSLVGESANEKLPEYADVLRRVTSSNDHDSFRVALDGHPSVIFSSETDNGWYLILSVDADSLYAESYRLIATMTAVNLLMLLVVLIFYAVSIRNRKSAVAALAANERFIESIADRLRQPASQIVRLSDWQLLEASSDPEAIVEQMRESGAKLSDLADNVSSYSQMMRERIESNERRKEKKRVTATGGPSRRLRNGVIAMLLVSLAIGLFFCVRMATNWGDTTMSREADRYENQLNEWVAQQKGILYLFTDVISAKPELMDDYNEAVQLLDSIARDYPQISACYMANPYNDPSVIMNNGWIPDESDRPETRPWYQATERAADGFNISAPYLDVPTGNYCITLSRVVNGANGEFLGIFGIDFFLDKLVDVLGESYTSESYAFLVDPEGSIVNYPDSAYQMSEDVSVSIEDTEYAEAYHSDGITVLTDHAGTRVACLSRDTDSGFTVIVANSWWSVYGSTVFVAVAFLVVFGICIIAIVVLINRLIRWQEQVNQQLVEAAEAAVNAGKAKSQFLAQMSHEIRTPMNAIIGLDNLALRDPDLMPQTRDQLEKIGASATHLLALINDILDMSRIESGRMEIKEREFVFQDLLDQINVIINGQCADKGLRYECATAGSVDECFMGDDLKLKQVCINILGNSVKFTEVPGTVTFSVEELDRHDGACILRFMMKDTGIGMDKEFIPKLFEAFSQECVGSTDKYGGTGLGMAITKNIVEMMGGTIEVESEKGIGTTFFVSVPLKMAQKAAPVEDAAEKQAAEEEESVSLEGVRVLIAEDVEINAEVLADLLEMEEVESDWAENGKIAVEMFEQSDAGYYDAVLMDMRMPVMDGLTAAREIRKLEHPDAASVPIIALTANAFEEDVKNCLDAGMNLHLSKPIDIDLLMQALRRFIVR